MVAVLVFYAPLMLKAMAAQAAHGAATLVRLVDKTAAVVPLEQEIVLVWEAQVGLVILVNQDAVMEAGAVAEVKVMFLELEGQAEFPAVAAGVLEETTVQVA